MFDAILKLRLVLNFNIEAYKIFNKTYRFYLTGKINKCHKFSNYSSFIFLFKCLKYLFVISVVITRRGLNIFTVNILNIYVSTIQRLERIPTL